MSDSLQTHELQHARLPCASPTPRAAQTHVHRVGDAIQPSHSLSSPSPPAFNLFQHQGLFQGVSSSHQAAKVLELQLQHQSELISFRIDWFDLLAVQGTLKSLLQLSHPYMTSGKTIALTIIRTFVGKVMCMLFNILSRFVIAFLPRRKCLLISWLQSLSAVILELKKINTVTASTFPLLFVRKWWDWMPWSSFSEW